MMKASKPITPSPRTTPTDNTKPASNINTPPVTCGSKACCMFMCEALVNFELLYLKAKMFHWNVRGSDFKQLHETFDEIQEVALDAADRVAERHRFLGDNVDNSVAALDGCRWYPDGNPTLSMQEMKVDMVRTLDCINCHIMDNLSILDDVTSNIFQDICGEIDKMNYFVRSSLDNAA